MGKGFKVCKICGKEYEYCKSFKPSDGTFRWQDVGCCIEHANQYLSAVLASRDTKPKAKSKSIKKKDVVASDEISVEPATEETIENESVEAAEETIKE